MNFSDVHFLNKGKRKRQNPAIKGLQKEKIDQNHNGFGFAYDWLEELTIHTGWIKNVL